MSTKDLNLRVTADTANAKRGLAGLDATMKSMLTTTAALAAGYAFARKGAEEFAKALNLAGIQELAEKKVAQGVIATGKAAGYSAQQLKAMATDMQVLTGIGDELVLGTQAIELSFTRIADEVFPAVLMAAADVATVMGTDLKSTMLQVAKAVNDPAVGMSMLARSGITFTQQQKDMVKQLVASNKLLDAQVLILEELNSQYGGQAIAAMDTYAQRVIGMNAALGDLSEVIGSQSIPILGELATTVTVLAERWQKLVDVRGMAENFEESDKSAFGLISTMLKMTQTIPKLFAAGESGEIFGTVLEEVRDRLSGTTEAAARFQKNWDDMMSKVESSLDIIRNTDESWMQLRDDVDGINVELERTGNSIPRIIELYRELGDVAPDAFKQTKSAMEQATHEQERIANGIAGTLTPAITGVIMGTKTLAQAFEDFGRRAVAAIVEAIIQMTILNMLTGGGAGFGSRVLSNLFGFASGGTIENMRGRPVLKAASGMDFTVPGGFPNDSFPIMVQSGERVQVTPTGQAQNSAPPIVNVYNSIDPISGQARTVSVIAQRGDRARAIL